MFYDGEWKDGKCHGQGIKTWLDGDKYDGIWEKGKKKHGHYYWGKTGNAYKGEWKDDKKHGCGVMTWANGKKYDGEYKDDKIHGNGVITYTNGNKYDGEFKNDFKNGHGVYTWNDGSIYTGNWFEEGVSIANGYNGRNGTGIMIWSTTINWAKEKWAQGQEPKLKFEGEWKNHHEFKGTVLYADGRIYKGEFDERKPHGKGFMTYKDGHVYEGMWEHGKVVD
jgi:hypothetical protein